MANRIQYRRDTAANWTAANPVLALGEPGYETDTSKRKIGDGTTAWTSLAYQIDKATADATYAANSKAGLEATAGVNSQWLRAFHSRLADRDTARVPILWIGDSTTEGAGISNLATRSPDALQRVMRARFPLITPTGTTGSRYYPSYYAGSSLPNAWTMTGSPALRADFGIGRRNANFTAAGTASITFTGTDATLFYAAEYNAAGSFTYAIDGGAATTVNMTATTTTSAVSGRTINFTGLSAGSHTLVITWVSGSVHVNGLWVFNGDYAKDIHVLDGAHSGFATYDFSINTFWQYDNKAVNPALVLLQLGFNDQRIRSTSSAGFATNLNTIITNLRSAVTTAPFSIGLVANYVPTGTFTEPWSNYVTAMQNIAAADPNIGFIDLSKRMEATTAGNTFGAYQSDLLHPTNRGMDYIANVVAASISPK